MEDRKIKKESKVTLLDRHILTITGIEKVIAVNENNVGVIIDGSELVVNGKNMHTNRLDVESGVIEIEGEIDSLKYQNVRKKEGLLKRIFK